jgi:DNA-directed RNA polymerase subunit E'/Rpb7
MMDYKKTMTFSETVILSPTELSNIYEHLQEKINNRKNNCTKTDGIITEINEIDWNSLTNKISRISGNCIFNVNYTAKVLKPENGHIYTTLVNIIFKEGIFTEYNNIKILIPSDSMDGWSFRDGVMEKTEIGGVSRIETGDWVKVIIRKTRYETSNYQCIGELIIN